MKERQVLVEAQGTALQVFDKFEAEIVEFEKYFNGKEYDLTTEKGIEACEGDKLLLRKVEIRIDKTRKDRGKSLRDAITELNASAKVCHNRVHTMWEVIDKPLAIIRQANLDAAIDAKEKADAEAKAIEDKRLAGLQAREDAANTKEAELKVKEDALNSGQIKKDLEEAKITAANDAVIAEQAKQLAKKNRLAKAEKARLANVEHCKIYNNLALDAIVAITGDPASSLRVVKAIVKGEIPNVVMMY